MGKNIVKQFSAAFEHFKNDTNPLMVRKKFQMKDVYFRRDLPEQEVFRCELAFDTELYVLLLAAAALSVLLVCRLCRAGRYGYAGRMKKCRKK